MRNTLQVCEELRILREKRSRLLKLLHQIQNQLYLLRVYKEDSVVLEHYLIVAQHASPENGTVFNGDKVVKKLHSFQTLLEILLLYGNHVRALNVFFVIWLLFFADVVIYDALLLVYEAGQLHDKIAKPSNKYVSYVFVHAAVDVVYQATLLIAIVLELQQDPYLQYLSTKEHLLDDVYVLQELHEGQRLFRLHDYFQVFWVYLLVHH